MELLAIVTVTHDGALVAHELNVYASNRRLPVVDCSPGNAFAVPQALTGGSLLMRPACVPVAVVKKDVGAVAVPSSVPLTLIVRVPNVSEKGSDWLPPSKVTLSENSPVDGQAAFDATVNSSGPALLPAPVSAGRLG